jgi:hypothetical protein
MEANGFVKYAKRYAVDDTVVSMLRELASPRISPKSEPQNEIQRSISEYVQRAEEKAQQQSAWFLSLETYGQQQVRNLLQECAEHTLLSFFCLLDGVGGQLDGVFEIVQVVDEEDRTVLNPENTDFLHTLLSEVCERDREINSVDMDSEKDV